MKMMKNTYLTPIVKVDVAQPANLLCESLNNNAGIENGDGRGDDARAPEANWDMWGGE